jgi:hypothetical protein
MVRMFKPQFAPLVEAGTKRQTIRPEPKRMPREGAPISLRAWLGAPYRSKQRVLKEATVTEVRTVKMDAAGVCLYDGFAGYAPADIEQFARADGFASWAEMRDWFQTQHGLPFRGVLIKW